jgi:hypothetical protein
MIPHYRYVAPTALLAALAGVPAGLVAADGPAPAVTQADLSAEALQRRIAALEQRTGAGLRLVEISLDVIAAAGGSTATDEQLEALKAGGHDPKRNGLTLQGAELSIVGAVDTWFRVESHLVGVVDGGEAVIELEEAFFATTGLAYGLEVKGGLYQTEFGRINSTHAHAWAWMDQPVINSRLFGPDGLRAPGLRIAWRLPLPESIPVQSQVIVGGQNADAETMPGFLGAAGGHSHGGDEAEEEHGDGVAGWPDGDRTGNDRLRDLTWSARWEAAGDIGDTTLKGGISGLRGPNRSSASASTTVWGVDLAAKWRIGHGTFVQVEAEFASRRYQGASIPGFELVDDGGTPDDPSDDVRADLEGRTLIDQGGYAQVLYGFAPSWAAGLRVDHAWATGNGPHDDEPRDADALRDRRWRVSPLVAYRPSEFSRIRLQYDYDQAQHLAGGPAHSVWMGVELLIGAHPPHLF